MIERMKESMRVDIKQHKNAKFYQVDSICSSKRRIQSFNLDNYYNNKTTSILYCSALT